MVSPDVDLDSRGVAAPASARLALVCLGGVPWGRSWKRIQSMVYQLSQRPLFERAVFVNPQELWIRDEITDAGLPLRDRLRRIASVYPGDVDGRVRVITLARFLPSLGRFTAVRTLEDRIFQSTLNWQRAGLPFVLLNNHPNFFSRSVLTELMDRAVLTVYDMSDDFVEYHQAPIPRAVVGESVAFSCRNSDVVFTINEHVRDKYAPLNANIHVIGNCTNFANFDRASYREFPFMTAIRARRQPVLGYTGIINRVRVDYELLTELLEHRPQWQFVFIGSADQSFLALVERFDNLHYHPQVEYADLPDHIASFDVAVIPFRVNEHTRGNDLLKFNDYLAMGCSIVTTDTGGAQKYRDHVRIAHGVEDFERAIEQALTEDRTPWVPARRAVARANSWEHRAVEIETLLRGYLNLSPEDQTAQFSRAAFDADGNHPTRAAGSLEDR